MKKLFLAAVVMLGFAACTNDATEDVAVDVPETLTVSFEESSRVQLQNDKTVWNVGDLVSVFYRSDANQQWKFQGKTGDRVGTLKRVSTPQATEKLSKVVVVYPYNENYYINPESCNIQAFMPAEQTYLEDSYGIDGNIMISQSEYNQFSLKNVCGWLKIQLKGDGQVVQKITLKGNNGEQVAGEIYINTADATATLAAKCGIGADDTEVGGTMVEDDTILTEVTLNCGAGVTLGAEPTAFYIALPPQTFESGFTVTATCSDGSSMTKSTSDKIIVARNTIQPMESLDYKADIPNNQIWYTSINDKVVTPYAKTVFGANIVSNTYENGQGVITFDADVTSIGAYAFQRCSRLTSVTIPDSVTSIGKEGFYGCNSLTSVTIPDSVTSIGDYAFQSCSGLQAFYGKYASSDNRCLVINGVLNSFAPSGLTSYTIPDSVTSIGYDAFYGCSGLTSVTIPESVTSIGDYAFQGCSSLTSVTISESVTSIGNSAFEYCSSLTSVTIPDSVTSIGDRAFFYCSSLTSVTIGNSVTSIGDRAFENCSSLKSVTIPDSVTSIGKSAFYYCSSLTSVTIPDSVTSIGDSAFYYCSSLTSVHISDLSAWCKIDFKNDASNPLYYAKNLYLNGVLITELTIPSDITEIKKYAFENCSSLTSVTIPDSITSIGNGAFANCGSLQAFYGKYASSDNRCLVVDGVLNSFVPSGLTSYTIPDSITSIGYAAFSDCRSLTSVTIPDSVTSIGDSAFSSCSSLTSITIPDSVTLIGNDAFAHCRSLTSVHISDLSAWCKIDFENYNSNPLYHAKNLYLNGDLITELTIPSDITEIKKYAFYNCSSLTSVTIPDSVTSIGDCAFLDCSSLTSVTIGNGVTAIGNGAFSYCSSLTSVTIGNSVTSIGEDAFYECSGLTSVTIPDSVTSIGKQAFVWCGSLTSVTIGNSVTSIGDYAFYSCSSLKSVTIGNNVTSIGNWAFYECSSLTSVYCKPTTPPTLSYSVFDRNATGRKIYVPAASVDAYKAAYRWSEYKSSFVAYDFE